MLFRWRSLLRRLAGLSRKLSNSNKIRPRIKTVLFARPKWRLVKHELLFNSKILFILLVQSRIISYREIQKKYTVWYNVMNAGMKYVGNNLIQGGSRWYQMNRVPVAHLLLRFGYICIDGDCFSIPTYCWLFRHCNRWSNQMNRFSL